MANNEPSPRIDPELRRQLDAARATGRPVAAVVRLRPEGDGDAVLTAEQTQSRTARLLERVERTVGLRAQAVNVFEYLGSFVVVAPPRFLVELLAQPEVLSAVANRQPDDPSPPDG